MNIFDMPWSDTSQEEREAHFDNVLRTMLDETGDECHIVKTGETTGIVTRLRRMELVDYLTRLAEELAAQLDSESTSANPGDLVHLRQEELGNGESITSAILRVQIS
jgi:hypothetical protein